MLNEINRDEVLIRFLRIPGVLEKHSRTNKIDPVKLLA